MFCSVEKRGSTLKGEQETHTYALVRRDEQISVEKRWMGGRAKKDKGRNDKGGVCA